MCYVWDQAVQQEFFRRRDLIVHSLLKYFFQISVVILNSTLHYQILIFDIDIQILVWIFGKSSIYVGLPPTKITLKFVKTTNHEQ